MSSTAVVVGSGPNGLAAAIVLARAGLAVTVLEAADTIGGGTRTEELTVPGLLHDVCSAAHPIGAASPFFRSLDLAAHGLELVNAEVEVAHVLDGGRAGVMHRDLEATAAGLGADGAAWRSLYGPLVGRTEQVAEEILRPLVHVPRHPVALARFGPRAVLPARAVARRWSTDEARGLFAGFAAHVVQPLSVPSTGGIGLMFGMLGHTVGWPFAVGGSRAITDALASVLRDLGGTIETGTRVTRLPRADVVMLDTSPTGALEIAGDVMSSRVARAMRRWRHGGSAFKVDLAVRGGIPWTNPEARRAGTVHVGGTLEEVHAAELDVRAGRMPERPFVLVCQQHLADPSRSVGDLHPVWAYAHVPHGWTGDATEAVLAQLERFAPGVRDVVEAVAVRTPADLAAENANYVGGDISGGAMTFRQTVLRPRLAVDPYRLADGVYLCSASTPPGGGVHGMAGFHAATSALRDRWKTGRGGTLAPTRPLSG